MAEPSDWGDLSCLEQGNAYGGGSTQPQKFERFDWVDTRMFDDDHDNEWFEAEEKRLCEIYGGPFIKVKYLQQGNNRIGYFCELCLSEMNTKKVLESHCSGMKHLKKKNLYENPPKVEEPDPVAKKAKKQSKKEKWHESHKAQGNANMVPIGKRGPDEENPWEPGREIRGLSKKKKALLGLGLPSWNFSQDSGPYETPGLARKESKPQFSQPGASEDRSQTISKRSLSKSPAGRMLEKIAECCVKTEEDSALASNVVFALTRALKVFHEQIGEKKISQMLQAAETKMNSVKALESGLKLLGKSSGGTPIPSPYPLDVSPQTKRETVPLYGVRPPARSRY